MGLGRRRVGAASEPSTSAATSPVGTAPAVTDAPDASASVEPTDPPVPTAAPDESDGASPAETGSDQGAGLPTDPALLGTGLVPDGWQIVEDATAACRIAVPPDWVTDVAPGTGQSSILAEALGAVNADTQEWDAFKQAIDQSYLSGHVTVIDTDDVFMIANPVAPELNLAYLLGLRFDDVNCSVLVTVQGNGMAQYAAEAALISQTLDHTD